MHRNSKLPSLETIRIENGGRLEAGLDDITAVLRRAQNLVECTLEDYRYHQLTAEKLVLPYLKVLNLEKSTQNTSTTATTQSSSISLYPPCRPSSSH
jgi:DNA polymerase elongation subunit (family B)